jgi:hypothetical protein
VSALTAFEVVLAQLRKNYREAGSSLSRYVILMQIGEAALQEIMRSSSNQAHAIAEAALDAMDGSQP